MKFTARDMTYSAIFSALMAVGAIVSRFLPASDVPFSLQPVFCALCGIILGAKRGLMAQIVYIALGLIGLPIFSLGGGIYYFLKPTFGFIIGFAVASFVIGIICDKFGNTKIIPVYIASMLGLAIIYLFGISYFYLITRVYLGKQLTLNGAMNMVFLPFIFKDFLTFNVAIFFGIKLSKVLKKAELI